MNDQSHSIDKPLSEIAFSVSAADAGRRLDQLVAEAAPEFSRTRLQSWIRQGLLTVDGAAQVSPRVAAVAGQAVRLELPGDAVIDTTVHAEDIALEVLFEDADLIVLNKPAGLTVHPGAGQRAGTLQNALLHHRPELAAVPRAGIVHRLDKLTSGVLVIAANLSAHTALVRDLADRSIGREYMALVWGEVIAGGTIDAPLARDPRDRRRYVVANGGRNAITHFRVAEKFPRHTLLRVQLETGRTHQIRVHMQHRRLHLVGDPVYGRRGDPYRAVIPRQALHATVLQLRHPRSTEELRFEVPMPADMQAAIAAVRGD